MALKVCGRLCLATHEQTAQDRIKTNWTFFLWNLKRLVCNPRKAKNLFEVLLLSSGDRRFNQFVTCLNILFDCDINNLLEEYNEIKKMTEKIESPHDYMSDQFNYFRVSRVSDFVYSNNRIVQKCHISISFVKVFHAWSWNLLFTKLGLF